MERRAVTEGYYMEDDDDDLNYAYDNMNGDTQGDQEEGYPDYEDDVDDIDHEEYKGIYFNDDPSKKFQDEATGAHFDYSDMCKRLVKINDRHLREEEMYLQQQEGLVTYKQALGQQVGDSQAAHQKAEELRLSIGLSNPKKEDNLQERLINFKNKFSEKKIESIKHAPNEEYSPIVRGNNEKSVERISQGSQDVSPNRHKTMAMKNSNGQAKERESLKSTLSMFQKVHQAQINLNVASSYKKPSVSNVPIAGIAASAVNSNNRNLKVFKLTPGNNGVSIKPKQIKRKEIDLFKRDTPETVKSKVDGYGLSSRSHRKSGDASTLSNKFASNESNKMGMKKGMSIGKEDISASGLEGNRNFLSFYTDKKTNAHPIRGSAKFGAAQIKQISKKFFRENMSSLGTYSNKIKVSRNSKVEKNDSLTNTVKLRSSSQNRATIDLSKSPVLNKKHTDPHPPISDFENGLPKKSLSIHKTQISGGNPVLKNLKQPVNTKDLISSIHKNDLLKNFGTSHNLYSSIYGLKSGAYDISNMKVSSVHRGTGSRNTAYTQDKKAGTGKFIKSAKINKEDLMGGQVLNNRSFNP